MTPTHLDLFSGIGGFALAAQWAGFETVGFSEVDLFCIKVLKKNFPDVLNYGDIKQLKSPPSVDLITGGFPCQPFSTAGNKKGVDDDRYLWGELRRVIYIAQPDWVIIENVCGLIPVAFDNIIADLASKNYSSSPFILPACAANAPHRRDRLWIIAYHDRVRSNERFRNWQTRSIQENLQRNMAEIQQEWTQRKPITWSSYTARDWLNYNTAASRGHDGIPTKLDRARIKAIGNAIVPQVIYPVLKYIHDTYQTV